MATRAAPRAVPTEIVTVADSSPGAPSGAPLGHRAGGPRRRRDGAPGGRSKDLGDRHRGARIDLPERARDDPSGYGALRPGLHGREGWVHFAPGLRATTVVPAGSGSERVTFCATFGPTFVILAVSATVSPAPSDRRVRERHGEIGPGRRLDDDAHARGVVAGPASGSTPEADAVVANIPGCVALGLSLLRRPC
jgi:hypothetical protein